MKTYHPALIFSALAALGLAGCAAPPPTTPPSATTVPAIAPPGLRKATLRVEGMTWATGWPPKVYAALVRVEGFRGMQPDVAKQEVEVLYDPARTSPREMARAINASTDFRASAKWPRQRPRHECRGYP